MKRGLLVALLALSGVSPAGAQKVMLNNDSIFHLHWEGGTCIFSGGTTNFENDWNGTVLAWGDFGAGCSGSAQPGPASAALSVTPANVNAGAHITVTWSGAGDVCRNTGSTGPAAVPGWALTETLCVGASECGAQHTITPQLVAAGAYTFVLTCLSGATTTTPQTEDTATSVVHVY